MKLNLEICAGSLRSALAAQEGGADRIELCDNLSVGGTTPSYGMIKTCRSLLKIPVFPIIRPRGGDFIYSEEEFEVMKQDIICCRELGCEGVVFGVLRAEGTVDIQHCAELVNLAGDMEITFHRAFDSCHDLEKGLEDVISLGFHRILTSGGQLYAENAIPTLKRLVKQAGSRISIMPGSGITDKNLLQIAMETDAFEFHTTAKKRLSRPGHSSTGTSFLYETDASKIKKMMQVLSLVDD